MKKSFLEISQNSQENACVRDSFIIKLQACNFIKKESLAKVFSCEFCEISKNTFLYRTSVAVFVSLALIGVKIPNGFVNAIGFLLFTYGCLLVAKLS